MTAVYMNMRTGQCYLLWYASNVALPKRFLSSGHAQYSVQKDPFFKRIFVVFDQNHRSSSASSATSSAMIALDVYVLFRFSGRTEERT